MKDNSTALWLPPLTFLISFLVLYFSAMPLLDDPDVPWHLATGSLLLETHRLPVIDPWSFSSEGAPWYLLSWVWDVLLGIVESIGDTFGVFIFTITFAAGLLAFLASELQARDIALPAVLLTLLLATLCLLEFTSARPHLAGYALALVFHAILHRSRASGRYGTLLLLPPLMVLWANTHGSFIVGFTLLGVYVLEAWATGRIAWFERVTLITGACIILALANPYGFDVLTGALRTLDGAAQSFLIEWQPFVFGRSAGLSAWLLVIILAGDFRSSRVPLADKLISFIWLIAGLMITRNGAILVLLSAPFLASSLEALAQRFQAPQALPPIAPATRQEARQMWAVFILAAIMVTAIAALSPHDWRLQSDKHSVRDAIDFALLHEPDRHYLTDFDYGGQVIYFAHDRLEFFMDSRSATAYDDQGMHDYLSFFLLRPHWEERLAARGVDALMVSNLSRFALAYADGQYQAHWKLVFAGKIANVYIARP